jgi:hypothetical protein
MGFADDINKFAQKSVANANTVVRRTVIDVGQRVITRTPVGDANFWQSKPPAGYVGGHARFNWMYSMNTRVIQELDGIDTSPGGAATLQRLTGAVPLIPGDAVHYIQNSVPYIERLEDGYSRQAPNGFVALTAAEFQGIVSEEVSKL